MRNESSDRGFGAIEIDNTGSVYIDRVWLNNSVPSTDPFGSGSAGDYDAGNFLEVKPADSVWTATSTSDYYYINRKEYLSSDDSTANGVTDIPSFIQVGGAFSNPYEVGEINRGNETIYFAVQADSSDDTCNSDSAGAVRVGNVSSTDNRLGTVDFSDDGNDPGEFGWREYDLDALGNTDYGIFSADLNWTYSTSSDQNVDILTRCAPSSEQPHAIVNKYNVNAVGANDLGSDSDADNTGYLLEASSPGNMLAPGDMATVETAINIPEGVAAGSVDSGTLRVLITADIEADTS